MRCTFEGGNLTGSYLDVDEREIGPYRTRQMCCPDQPADQVRSHGRCVCIRTERTREHDGASWVVFTHYGDWVNYEPGKA